MAMKVHKTWQGLQQPSFSVRSASLRWECEGHDDSGDEILVPLFLRVLCEHVFLMLSHDELLNATYLCKHCKCCLSRQIVRVTTPANAFLFNRRFYFVCKRFPNMLHVSTRSNVDEHGVQEISRALALGVCPNLRTITLGGSTVGDMGIVELANAIQAGGCRNLRSLDLGVNFMGDRGVRQLAHALSFNTCRRLERIALMFRCY